VTLPPYLRDIQTEVEQYARDYGLDFFPVIFEVLGYKQMNEVAAYGGFPTRYPHWRFGMDFEGLAKGYEYGLQKIYEMVINNNPSYAYLLEGNSIVDQKTVMAHVFGHVDFFKNNYFFSQTNRRMIDGMANHATRVRKHIERHGIDKIELFIDTCLSLETLIDPMSPFIVRRAKPPREEEGGKEKETAEIPRLRSKDYMDRYINPPSFMEKQKKLVQQEKDKVKKFPEEKQRDVLLFLIENAPLEKWERDILEIVRAEAYYFAPQGQTKVLNEGWACIASDSIVFTERGVITMGELVGGDATTVYDGRRRRRVYDRNIIRDHETVEVRTRRGLRLCGSNNHRLLLPDGATWRRLDELQAGDRIAVSGGGGMWARELVELAFSPRAPRPTLESVADQAGVSVWTVLRHRAGRNVRQATAVAAALETYDEALPQRGPERKPVRLPARLDEHLASFLGYLVGDGHISIVKRNLGLTTGDDEQAAEFMLLAQELFGVLCSVKKDGNRWRVLVHSQTVSDFLVEAIGLTTGPSARQKKVPDAILRSPETVVRRFLRSYFDCDGYAGDAGVILSTSSETMSEQVQLLLLNFGILSRRRAQQDGCWHVHVAGKSAQVFADKIGFGLKRKHLALAEYLRGHQWFLDEKWEDEVVSLERGRGDVYDISVEETHRYAACGFINHNSYWHSRIMTEKALRASEIIDYADANAGILATSPGQLNPYKLGVELLRHIEDRWNKGRFGKEWNECEDMAAKKSWDRRLGLGRQKIFEVRKLYNDVTFIDEFFTLEFCHDQKFYAFGFNERSGNWEIESREFKKVKDRLLFRMTNHGQPFIYVIDGNFENRGEILLRHQHEGVDLKLDHARDTLANVSRVWKRPANLITKIDGKGKLLRFDGRDHSEKGAEYA
jgi:stage V sporulation protein R